MGVTRRSIVALVALLATIALAFPVYAHPDRTDLTLSRTCLVGQASLQAGQYKVEFNGDKVSFIHKGKVVAEANGEWKKTPGKTLNSSVIYQEDGRIIEIHVAGRDSYFVVQ